MPHLVGVLHHRLMSVMYTPLPSPPPSPPLPPPLPSPPLPSPPLLPPPLPSPPTPSSPLLPLPLPSPPTIAALADMVELSSMQPVAPATALKESSGVLSRAPPGEAVQQPSLYTHSGVCGLSNPTPTSSSITICVYFIFIAVSLPSPSLSSPFMPPVCVGPLTELTMGWIFPAFCSSCSGGQAECYVIACAPPYCGPGVQPVSVPGQCCPECPPLSRPPHSMLWCLVICLSVLPSPSSPHPPPLCLPPPPCSHLPQPQ